MNIRDVAIVVLACALSGVAASDDSRKGDAMGSMTGSRGRVADDLLVVDGMSLVASSRSQGSALIGTDSSAQVLEGTRPEPSTRIQPRSAGVSAHELEPSGRERLAAGLLLGVALYGRQR